MTDNKGKELLPCPFCGGAARILWKTMLPDISCSNSACGLYFCSLSTAMWNRRASIEQEQPAHPACINAAILTTYRREYLFRCAPICPSCKAEQVQCVDWLVVPSEWKCRECKERFWWEPMFPDARIIHEGAIEQDARRYRQLGVLVEAGEWSCTMHTIIDSYGATKDEHMGDKDHMDAVLDLPGVVKSAKEWDRAMIAALQEKQQGK